MKRTAKRMTERERFEAAMAQCGFVIGKWLPTDQRYESYLDHWAWTAWQAAKRDERRKRK